MEPNDENEKGTNSCKIQDQPRICLETLPHEVFSDILSRLHIISLMQCKLVSQLWHSSVKHPLSISAHLSRAKGNNPFVLCFSDYPTSKLDVIDLSSPENNTFSARTLNFPVELILPSFDVVGSCNGLLCLVDRSRNNPLFIYNPFTREYRELPQLIYPSHLKVRRVVFGFGFHTMAKEYKVIKLVYYTESDNIFTGATKEPEVYVLTVGSSEWRHIGQRPYWLSCMASDTLVNGSLHWLTISFTVDGEKRRDIISFDLATEEFCVIPQPSSLGMDKFLKHVVVLENRLSAVVSSQGGEIEMWALKNYTEKDSWTREFIIPKYVPEGFIISSAPPARIRWNGSRREGFRVLCTLKGVDKNQILFSYRDRCLVSFNPESGEFKDFKTQGLPIEFETLVHVGSLVPVDAAFADNLS